MLRLFELRTQCVYALTQLFGDGVERARELDHKLPLVPDQLVGGLPHHHVDSPEARADARLGKDHDGSDVGGVRHVGASAELARPVAEAHDPDDVPVLLVKQVHSALRHRFFVRLLALVEWQRLAHLLHHTPVDTLELVVGDGTVERDVERRVIGSNPGTLLHDLLAERLAQRLVKEVSGGMVTCDLSSAFCVDGGDCRLRHPDLTCNHGAEVSDRAIHGFLGVLDADLPARRRDRPFVSDLSTGLRIERRAIEEYLHRIALASSLRGSPVHAQAFDVALGCQLAIACELGFGQVFGQRPALWRTATRARSLLFHSGAKAVLVDLDATLRGQLARQLQRKAVRVMEAKRIDARDRLLVLSRDLLELLHALLERLVEPVGLSLYDLGDPLLVLAQLGIVIPEHRHRHADS